ncbi:MAG: isoleucine--tRNA ligase [Candidatus Berkelbacteria bacterium]|nr:isoleucine--tRNA ligase [Candidatus Berkelbacteria bacterium]
MKSEFAKKEEEILEFWKKNNLFIRSIEDRPEDRPYVFYDGPPFATGLPHYGHILSSVIKDLVPRYWTMKGFRVARRWGWDCHGLPIETVAEKELKISGKKQIEGKGVELFNKTARNLVSSFVDQWEKTIERIGRWVNFDNSYKTMDSTYMESVWWALKTLWDKGLIYEGLRVLMYCPRCETPVSNAEIAMDSSYRDTTEDSVVVKFHLLPSQKFAKNYETRDSAYILAWTTTPWTLPGNVALAVGESIDYTALRVKDMPELLIIASDLVPKIFKNKKIEIVHDRIKGKDMVGLEYEPLFEVEKVKNSGKRAWYITSADFVKTEEGTGVVHTAVIYGEEDFELGKKVDLPQVPLLDSSGHYNDDAPEFIRGKFYKEAEESIVDDLKKRNLIYRIERHTHSYPFCWRCEAPLIYNAISSWFINIQKDKQRIIELNEKINWHPEFLKHGRFLNIVKEAPDWNISRNRYWATPLPFFKCSKCKEAVCIGSVAELKEKALNFEEVYKSEKVEEIDLHRPYIDQVKLKCSKCEGEMIRIPEVVDCWVESSSMPFAEWHYPFENKEIFEKRFPGQFIGEYVAQTRTWFYYMHVLAVLLFDNIAYENVVSTGTILAEDGSKMSKSKGNFPDPEEVIENFGADSLRFYLMSSVVMRSDNLFFNARDLRDVFNKTTNILYNVLRFYEVYSGDNANGSKTATEELGLIDRWIFSRAENLVLKAGNYLEQYNTVDYCREIRVFIDDLSTWWVRRSRERMKQGGEREARALKTLSRTLKKLATVIAPVMPFAAEGIWQKVREGKDPISVHLYLWAEADQNAVDSKIETDMEKARKICELGHSLRSSKGFRVRQPLSKIHFNYKFETDQDEFEQLILSELNVEKIATKGDLTDAQLAKEGELEVSMDFAIDKRLEELGAVRDLSRGIQQLRKSKGLKQGQLVGASYYCSDELKEMVEKNKTKLMASAALRSLNFKKELGSSEGTLEIPLLKCFIDIDEDSKDKS